jgi:hypothetical protein
VVPPVLRFVLIGEGGAVVLDAGQAVDLGRITARVAVGVMKGVGQRCRVQGAQGGVSAVVGCV